jgi:threonine dehydrogenase-like Zn-dependent dehydrogenase
VELGEPSDKFKIGDRVVVSPVIACGRCWYCQSEQYSLCDNTNPNAPTQEWFHGFATAGVFGFSHLFGGYAGGQAEFVRVPYADVGAFIIPDGMSDEQALACSDIFPTAYMGAERCELKGGETVAVWGCGPVGLFAIKSAYLQGAEQVIAIDDVPERLRLAASLCGATVLNHRETSVPEALRALTGGRGPDACIDAVGMEAHGSDVFEDFFDRAKEKLFLQSERVGVLREMIRSCRKGGIISLLGVYAGNNDMLPLGTAFAKSLQIRMGNMHGPKYMPRLFEHWKKGQIDPAFVFSHRLPLDLAPQAYRMFRDKEDECLKILLQP